MVTPRLSYSSQPILRARCDCIRYYISPYFSRSSSPRLPLSHLSVASRTRFRRLIPQPHPKLRTTAMPSPESIAQSRDKYLVHAVAVAINIPSDQAASLLYYQPDLINKMNSGMLPEKHADIVRLLVSFNLTFRLLISS